MLRKWNLLAALSLLAAMSSTTMTFAQVEGGSDSNDTAKIMAKSLEKMTSLIATINDELKEQKKSIEKMSESMKVAFKGVGNDIELLQKRIKTLQDELDPVKNNDLKQDVTMNKLDARLKALEDQLAKMSETRTSNRVATAARTGRIQFSNYFSESLTLIVDNQSYVGIAPGTTYNVENLASGVHTYEIVWPRIGWRNTRRTIDINPGETFAITATP